MSWSAAFARQAASDLDARDVLLREPALPDCHQLHFLQMACEKLCKAHLMAGGADALSLQGSHAYIAKQLPIIARQMLAHEASRLPKDTWVVKAIRSLARQIELLAPAVQDAGRIPADCEYPWLGPAGHVIAPADRSLGITILTEKAGATLLKIVRAATHDLASGARRSRTSSRLRG